MAQSRLVSFVEASSLPKAGIPGMPPVLLSLNVDASRMEKALKTADDIGAIVRIHKDLDRELKRIVSIMVRNSNRPKLHSMSQRIERLKAAGLSEKRLAASQTIDVVRSALVHGEKESLDETDVDQLLKAIQLVLGRNYTEGALHDLTTDPSGEWEFDEMASKGKFCLLGVAAVTLVASIANEFEKYSFKPKFYEGPSLQSNTRSNKAEHSPYVPN